MAFFAKFRRKLRTKNFEAHFNRKLRTLEKCSNVKKLRTAEPQPIFTGSYKKKKVYTTLEFIFKFFCKIVLFRDIGAVVRRCVWICHEYLAEKLNSDFNHGLP